jgi:ABC-type transporter Mla MlaB component
MLLQVHQGAAGVLKITQRLERGGGATLILEGALSGPWVDELQRTVERCREAGLAARLDLAAVQYVDARGQNVLGQLLDDEVDIDACSMFVAELLGRNRP